METSNLKEIFKAKLSKLFPNMTNFTFVKKENVLVLSFLNYELCSSILIPNCEDSLFQNGIQVLESLYLHYDNTIKEENLQKIKIFRDSMIKAEQHISMASSIRSKSDYYHQYENKRFKSSSGNPKTDECRVFCSESAIKSKFEDISSKLDKIGTEEKNSANIEEFPNISAFDDSVEIHKFDVGDKVESKKSFSEDSNKAMNIQKSNFIRNEATSILSSCDNFKESNLYRTEQEAYLQKQNNDYHNQISYFNHNIPSEIFCNSDDKLNKIKSTCNLPDEFKSSAKNLFEVLNIDLSVNLNSETENCLGKSAPQPHDSNVNQKVIKNFVHLEGLPDSSLLITEKLSDSENGESKTVKSIENANFHSSLILQDQEHREYLNGLNNSNRKSVKYSKDYFKNHFNISKFSRNSVNLLTKALSDLISPRKIVSTAVKYGFLPKQKISGVNFIDSIILNDSFINSTKHTNSSFNDLSYVKGRNSSFNTSSADETLKLVYQKGSLGKISNKNNSMVFTSISDASNQVINTSKTPLYSRNIVEHASQPQIFTAMYDGINSDRKASNFTDSTKVSGMEKRISSTTVELCYNTQKSINIKSETLSGLNYSSFSKSQCHDIEDDRPSTPTLIVPDDGEMIEFVGFTGIKSKNIEIKREINSEKKNKIEIPKNESQNFTLPKDMPPIEINDQTSFDTSCLYDKTKTNCDVNGLESVDSVKNSNKTDPKLLKEFILQNQNVKYGNINVIRSFCASYKIDVPEYEIVRENDVFRCTATFLDINFVSSYRYDKNDAKDDACCKIKEYVIENWTKIFKNL